MTTNRKHQIMRRIEERDGPNCSICELPLSSDMTVNDFRRRRRSRGAHGQTPLTTTLDHVLAERDGGRNDFENLRLAHKICNTVRGHSEITMDLRQRCRERVEDLRKKPVQVGPGG